MSKSKRAKKTDVHEKEKDTHLDSPSILHPEDLKITSLENIQVTKFVRAETRWKNAVNVWETAKDPIGYSIHKLAELTGINDQEVKEIVERLQVEGLIKEKNKGTFKGWVSIDDEKIYELEI